MQDNTEQTEATEVKEQQQEPEPEPQEEYKGPWIEKRIEYKAHERNRREVVVFGSWNGFRKGEDLEYQGKTTYAVTIKLPLGSHVYRFLIDNTDYETNNETAKTIKHGIEYNTITIKEKEESEEEDNNEEDKQQNTQVIFDESSQKFVVGKKKRRGRPSMEVDLGKDFNDEPKQEAETADDATKDDNNNNNNNNNNGTNENANTNANGNANTNTNTDAKSGKKKKKKESSSKSTKCRFCSRKRMGTYGICSTIKTTTTT